MEPNPQPEAPPLALVTGAARRLGRTLAIELARMGYAIGLHYYRSRAAAEATAVELESHGVPVFLLPADLADPAQIDALFEQVAALPFRLQVLVNSAAVMPRADVRQISAAEWDGTMALNLRAPLLCAQGAARLMPPGGLIVNVTDSGALRAWTGFPAYIVSKAGLESLTRLLARALGPELRVNAIAPGLLLKSDDVSDADWQRLVSRLPLKRQGTLDEVGLALRYLIENTYVTGQVLVVDGGYQLV